MARVIFSILHGILSLIRNRGDVALEIIALRHQLAVLHHQHNQRPRLRRTDRLLWTWLVRLWPRWRSTLLLVQPDTVIRWHRRGFKLYWRWKSRRRGPGRPRIDPSIRALIRRMSIANPLWGAPRIHGELLKLGIDVGQTTIAKYMLKGRKPPSQTWRTFLGNHATEIAALDFFTVPTATFQILFVLVVIIHSRRNVVQFNVTTNPTAQWTAHQVVEAFPWDIAPRYLLRDRDGIYGSAFRRRVKGMGIEEVLTAPRSPWQNPYVERLVGSVRRDCLDHVIALGPQHLHKILTSYFDYYGRSRTHLSLGKDCPEHRDVEPPEIGAVIELPKVGGLHHRYCRQRAA
jgi:putative transposase